MSTRRLPRRCGWWRGGSPAPELDVHASDPRQPVLQQLEECGIDRELVLLRDGARDAVPELSDRQSARRLRELIVLVTRVLAPVPDVTLRAALARFAYVAPHAQTRAGTIEDLLTAGRLEAGVERGAVSAAGFGENETAAIDVFAQLLRLI